MNKENFLIKENSKLARIAAWKLNAPKVAMVIGKTIHLHNTSSSEFLQNKRWKKHELKHIEQFRRHGFFQFLCLYLIESLRRGYYDNRFEVEARNAENED